MSNVLPEGYTEIEYIQSDGAQYIDTGIIANNNSRVILDFAMTGDYSANEVLFGARNNQDSINSFAFWNTGSNTFRTDYMGNKSDITVLDQKARQTVDKNKNITTLGNNTIIETESSGTDNLTITLFALNETAGVSNFSKIIVYSCKIYDNDILVRNFVPCINSREIVGLFDLVNNIFYSNANSQGKFIAGGKEQITVARKIKNIYIGKKTQIPIKENVDVTVPLNVNNKSTFFTIDSKITSPSTTAKWTYSEQDNSTGGIKYSLSNSDTANSTGYGTFTFLCKQSLTNVKVFYKGNFSSSYYMLISRNGVTLKTITSSTTGEQTFYIDSEPLQNGDTIEIEIYTYRNWAANIYFGINCDDITTKQEVVTGYEEKELARKVITKYVEVDKIARKVNNMYLGVLTYKQIANANPFSYTGTYSIDDVTKDDNSTYKLYTLKTSGTLTLKTEAEVWACGGGGGGGKGSSTMQGSGGGGGGGYVLSDAVLADGSYPVIIGAGGASNTAGGATSVGDLSANGGGTMTQVAQGGAGGSGGGGGGNSTPEAYSECAGGEGAGVSTYPFGLTSLDAHAAGGGGGFDFLKTNYSGNYYRSLKGGAGGTNGAAGAGGTKGSTGGGVGGVRGGGAGGSKTGSQTSSIPEPGSSASFYGSGGGGGGRCFSRYADGGSGYQGVVYVLIPTSSFSTESATKDITISVIWQKDTEITRPQTITITLLKNGAKTNYTLDASTNWQVIITGLDSNYEYDIEVNPIENYESIITCKEGVFTIINQYSI